jgi:glycerate 2-kinase
MGIHRTLLRRMFDAAASAAQPSACLPPHLPAVPKGRTIVIGAGKASAHMARVFERQWPAPLQGLVVTRHGHGVPCERIEIAEAALPVPDAAGLDAARRIGQLVAGLTEDDLVVCLMSAGGAALLRQPGEGMALDDEQAVSRALRAAGATVAEIHCVRRHLSAIGDGRLAAACRPARLVTLLMSDLPGEHPGHGASCGAEALAVLRRHAIDLPPPVRALLDSGAAGSRPGETPPSRCETHIIATTQRALEAAAAVARAAGAAVHLPGGGEGQGRGAGITVAGIGPEAAGWAQPFAPPCLLVSGGVAALTARGAGRGGRNVEFLLALGAALDGHTGIHTVACDTGAVPAAELKQRADVPVNQLHPGHQQSCLRNPVKPPGIDLILQPHAKAHAQRHQGRQRQAGGQVIG